MAKQKFNGKTIYTKTLVDNIKRVVTKWGDMSDALWYKDAYDYAMVLHLKHGVSLPKVVGIIAALSPQKSWETNKILASRFLKGERFGQTKVMLNKAQLILDGDGDTASIMDVLNGNKITSFFLNILYHDKTTVVTIDRHAIDIAVNDTSVNKQLTTKQYAFFQQAYIIAAYDLGIKPHELQAMTWVAWRKAKKDKLVNI